MLKVFTLFRVSLFLLILWPVYIALKIGVLPALSPDRVMVLILFLIFSISILLKSKKIQSFNYYTDVIVLLLIYFLWNIFSSMIGSDNIGSSVIATFNWFLIGPFLLFFIIFFINTKDQILKVIVTILFTMFIANVIGLVEVFKEELLFKNYLLTVNEYTLSALTEKLRGGSYRIRSVFSNPLVYSQFLLLVLPLQIYHYKQKKRFFIKLLLLLNIFLSLYLIYKTGSRAGLILAFAIPILGYYISMYNKSWFKPVSTFLLIVLIFILGIKANEYIEDNINIINNFHKLNVQGSVNQENMSTFARVLQFKYGYESIKEHPILGIGFGEAVKAVSPLKSIDNYYLTLVLSTGIIGLLIFLLFIYKAINTAIKNIKIYEDKLTLYVLLSIVLSLIYYFILSIPKANILLFILVGLIYVQSKLLRKRYNE